MTLPTVHDARLQLDNHVATLTLARDDVRNALTGTALIDDIVNVAEWVNACDEVSVLAAWRGSVLRAPAGEGGFGYDPLFLPEGETRSAAQMTAEEKDAVSHRRRAFTELSKELLRRLP